MLFFVSRRKDTKLCQIFNVAKSEKSVFSGVGDAELLADFLDKVVVDVGMPGHGGLLPRLRVDKNAVARSFPVEGAALTVEIPHKQGPFHATATLR